jgi:uncharacterized protein (DUF1684 family)
LDWNITVNDHHHAHTQVPYADEIGEVRAEKDAFFKESRNSPIPSGERAAFTGLPYYAVDEGLRFILRLEPLVDDLPVDTQVQTSDGAIRDGRRAGIFTFEVDGAPQRLSALQLAGSNGEALFVPFRDTTNGADTYEAGRYLDLDPLPDGTWDLDFNLAYAPFCAYSPHYSCPLPPAENRLQAAIAAGERNR